jgi:hypothetical protein
MQGACFSISSLGGIGWYGIYTHRELAGSGHSWRVTVGHEAGVEWQGFSATPDVALVAVV